MAAFANRLTGAFSENKHQTASNVLQHFVFVIATAVT